MTTTDTTGRIAFLLLVMLSVSSAILVACSGGDAASAGSLTIYSGRSQSLVDPIIEQFSTATGIEVGVKYANTAQLAATLLEEGDATRADIFFAQDPGGLGAVQEMLGQLPTEILDLVPDWARSPEGQCYREVDKLTDRAALF